MLANFLQGSSLADPVMLMNQYKLGRLLVMLKRHGIARVFIETTDHDGQSMHSCTSKRVDRMIVFSRRCPTPLYWGLLALCLNLKTLATNFNHPMPYYLLGRLYELRGERELAARNLQAFLFFNDPMFLRERGDALRRWLA